MFIGPRQNKYPSERRGGGVERTMLYTSNSNGVKPKGSLRVCAGEPFRNKKERCKRPFLSDLLLASVSVIGQWGDRWQSLAEFR